MADPKYVVCPVTIPQVDLAKMRTEELYDSHEHREKIHESLARDELLRICETYSCQVKRSWSAYDGWGDGFRVVHAELITRCGDSEIVKWEAGNTHHYFVRKIHIGWIPLTEDALVLELGARQLRRVYN